MESATIDEERSDLGQNALEMGLASGAQTLAKPEQDSKEELQKTKKAAAKQRKILSSENFRKSPSKNLNLDKNIPFEKQVPR